MQPDMLAQQIEDVLDGIRPRLHLDGADLFVISFSDDGVLRLQLTGSHACCPVAMATIQKGVEETIRERVPLVKRVVVVP